MGKQLVVALALLVLVGGGIGFWMWRRSVAANAGPRYETVAVDRGAITAKVTATGTLSALVTVQVGSQVSGRIKELLVDFNAPVKKGQVLARLDPEMFDAAVEQARANLLVAQGRFTTAEVQAAEAARQHDRQKQLSARGLIASAELDTAQASADAARAQVSAARGEVEQARAALRQAEVNLKYTTILSPITGVVISRNV